MSGEPAFASRPRIERDVAVTIDVAAVRIAMEWYRDGPDTHYHGISVGDLLAYDLVPLLIAELRAAALGEPAPATHIRPSPTPTPWARRIAKDLANRGFDAAHATAGALRAIRHSVGPGVHRPAGLRSIFFDPYVGYDRLLPALLGNAYERAIVPRPNVRRLPDIRRLERVLGVRAEYGMPMPRAADPTEVQRVVAAVAECATTMWHNDTLRPDVPVDWPRLARIVGERARVLAHDACAHIAGAEEFIARFGVDAVVVPFDEFGRYKALARVAQREKILNVRYEHGITNHFPALVPPTSDKVVAWDDVGYQHYRSQGVSVARLAQLPNPMTSALRQYRAGRDRSALRTAFGFSQDAKVVLFAETPFVGFSALDDELEIPQTLRDIASAVAAAGHAELAVKLHPHNATKEKVERTEAILAGISGLRSTVYMREDIRDLVIASDVVTGELSTVLREAAALERPAVAYTARPFVRELFAYGGDDRIRNAPTLIDLRRELGEALRSADAANTAGSMIRTDDPAPPDPDRASDPRWQVVSLVPADARRVLHVHCGTGWVGSHVKRTRPAWVAGVTPDPESAAAAAVVLDRVDVADLETLEPSFEPGSIDCIVCVDALEHARDPERVLRQFVDLLARDGAVVLSMTSRSRVIDVDRLVRSAGLTPVRTAANTAASRTMRSLVKLTGGALRDLIVFQHLVVARRTSIASS